MKPKNTKMKPKNTICLWFDKDALDAARFYAATFPDSEVTAVHKAPATIRPARRATYSRSSSPCWAFPASVSTAARRSGTARPFPSRSRRTLRKRRTATGMRSSAMAARKASAAGARTAGAFPGRSPRVC